MLQYRFYMDWLPSDVPPESFRAGAKVYSAVVRLIPRPASEPFARRGKVRPVVACCLRTTAQDAAQQPLRVSLDDGFQCAGESRRRAAPKIRAVDTYVAIANHLSMGKTSRRRAASASIGQFLRDHRLRGVVGGRLRFSFRGRYRKPCSVHATARDSRMWSMRNPWFRWKPSIRSHHE